MPSFSSQNGPRYSQHGPQPCNPFNHFRSPCQDVVDQSGKPLTYGGNGEGRHIGLPLRPVLDSSWGRVYGAHLCVRRLATRQTQERGRSRRPLVSEWLPNRESFSLSKRGICSVQAHTQSCCTNYPPQSGTTNYEDLGYFRPWLRPG